MERQRSIRRSYRNKPLEKRKKKPLGKKIKDFIRNFIAFMFSNVGIIGLVVGYTIAGAFMFIRIEKDDSEMRGKTAKTFQKDFIIKLWQLTVKNNPFNDSELRALYLAEVHKYQNQTVTNIINGKDYVDWTFSGAFLYSLTVITTIGYGNMCPRTDWGKVATILYAIIGMPLFLLYLTNFGDILARSFKWTYAKCCLCRGCPSVARRRAERRLTRRRISMQYSDEGATEHLDWESPQNLNNLEDGATMVAMHQLDDGHDIEDEDDDDDDIDTPRKVTVPVTLCLAIMVIYICGGAVLFGEYESWSFLDGSYFCFISLSTIGFGDLVPGDWIMVSESIEQLIEIKFVFCSVYLMLGMALIAMCFNLMQEEVIHKITSMMNTFRYIFRLDKPAVRSKVIRNVS